MRDRRWMLALSLGLLALGVSSRMFATLDAELVRGLTAWQPQALEAAARAVTFFGSSPWTLAVMAVMSVCWWMRGETRLLPVFWGALIGGLAIQVCLRLAVAQWRPDTLVIPAAGALIERIDLAGFPSGHAFRSAFLYGWWADVLRGRREGWAQAATGACGLLIAAIGLTRIYLGRHWPTDIVGAWLLAAFVLCMARGALARGARS